MLIRACINAKRCLNKISANHSILLKGLCSNPNTEGTDKEASQDGTVVKKGISKAMQAYLQRAKEHDEFMKEQIHEFHIGKRHLANMMGENPETFTQEDVDNAIQYLFPSGLFEKKARPLMRPPEEVFPQRKAAEFDETGRPFNFLFYCGSANFYTVTHNIVQHMKDLDKLEDQMISKNIQPDPNMQLDLNGFKWMEKEVLQKKLVEAIPDRDYATFLKAMERLVSKPYSYTIKDFILEYCTPLMNQSKNSEVPKPQYDKDGRAFITVYECLRKRARGHVTLRSPGTGQITINGEDIRYFKDVQSREQVGIF